MVVWHELGCEFGCFKREPICVGCTTIGQELQWRADVPRFLFVFFGSRRREKSIFLLVRVKGTGTVSFGGGWAHSEKNRNWACATVGSVKMSWITHVPLRLYHESQALVYETHFEPGDRDVLQRGVELVVWRLLWDLKFNKTLHSGFVCERNRTTDIAPVSPTLLRAR